MIATTYDKRVYYSILSTILGDLFISSTENGLCTLGFMEDDHEKPLKELTKYFDESNIIEDNEYNSDVISQLKGYFDGRIQSFNVKFDLYGTPFQKKVWAILTEINYGQLWTYRDVALKMGDVKKSRAVGGAIGKNPIAIIIPCHRVIGSNGKLTGFSAPGGIETKKKLLNLEGQLF